MLNSRQRQALAAMCGTAVGFDVSMADFCTLKAGGRADALIDIGELKLIPALLGFCRQEGIRWRVIGRGSNILVTDAGFPGILVRLTGEFRTVRNVDETDSAVVTAGGGCLLAELLGYCRRHGLGGLEFLTGIPGGVGGAVRMNAGAFGHAIGEMLERVVVVGPDGEVQTKMKGEWHCGYRRFELNDCETDGIIILSVDVELQKTDPVMIKETMEKYRLLRRDRQPPALPSAGSFFKNPAGDFAGRLIEASGLKGLCVGGAMVSPVHANFIINTGEATATDIINLMHRVQEKVKAETGIFLEPEVHII
jgi:UDP-N-acetylmuramate dehydrogenase